NWLLTKGVTSDLIGVRTKEQLLENLGALEHPLLSEEEMKKIDNIILFMKFILHQS
ncbi:MAG: aldo/keto reductase, partial [Eubacterium sp.]|nr:aldo/keto reductase [Eubacterium sp.]